MAQWRSKTLCAAINTLCGQINKILKKKKKNRNRLRDYRLVVAKWGQEKGWEFDVGRYTITFRMDQQGPKVEHRKLYSISYEIIIWCCSVTQSCWIFCNPMDCSTTGFPIHHQLSKLAQTHVHGVNDAIQSSHPLLLPSIFPSITQLLMCWLFPTGSWSIGASGSVSVLPMNIQDWFL